MPSTFDELLLDVNYTSDAEGGPEFASVVVRTGSGGAVSRRNANRPDFVGRFEIDFSVLTKQRRKALRSFAILRDGMTRGFRFLPPDDNEFVADYVGILNETTGRVEICLDSADTHTEFYTIKYFADAFNNYTRRIVKISPYVEFLIRPYLLAPPSPPLAYPDIVFPAIAENDPIPTTVSVSWSLVGPDPTVTLDYRTGKITFSFLPGNFFLETYGQFHLPVCFSEDWHKFSVDDGGLSKYRCTLEEILPVELGII